MEHFEFLKFIERRILKKKPEYAGSKGLNRTGEKLNIRMSQSVSSNGLDFRLNNKRI